MIALTQTSAGLETTGSRFSADALAREAQGFRVADAVDPETLDFIGLCLLVDIKPSRFHAMVAGLDKHDEVAIDSALRTGIHRMAPSIDGYAHLFVKHFCLPAHSFAEAAE